VWRTWLVAPDPRRPQLPILTGVMGFPWDGPEVDAKCTIRVRNPEGSVFAGSHIDRHHPRIPDPHCTCGLYAARQDLQQPPGRLIPPGVPIATGFAELSGPMLADATHFRAGHARIVGPLSISGGRAPIADRLLRKLGSARRPHSVKPMRKEYRVHWSSRGGSRFEDWRREVARRLRHRYGVEVA
jgi:hypothetical protein